MSKLNAKTYFDKKAKAYSKEKSSGFWGVIVKTEQKSVLKLLSPKKGETILDAGCGSGYYSNILKKLGAEPFGIDVSPNMVEECRKVGIEAKVANLEDFDLKMKFGKIICIGVLEFCENPLRVLKNLKKHLKKGGFLVLLFPKRSLSGYLYKLYHFTHNVRIKLFSTKDIKVLLQKSGFTIEKTHNPILFSCVVKTRT